jgi:phosphoribosyl 1,2-cyclic phosphate phosphodiesterase
LKITFLGTGTSQGVPVITCDCAVCKSDDVKDKRLRSSVLVETDGNSIVIDAGPDFRQQMLRENVQKLDGVLITHQHKDHLAGLDDVRAFNYHQKKFIDIYGDFRVIEAIKQEFAYSFAENKYPGVPDINLKLVENSDFKINNLLIIPIQVMHHKLPIFGYRIKDFTYITDANYIPEIEKEKIKDSKVLVLNALRIKKHLSHFNLEEALSIIEEIKPEKAYLTHISHYLGFYKEVEKMLPSNVFLSYDGLSIEI